jgi:cell division protein FtsB
MRIAINSWTGWIRLMLLFSILLGLQMRLWEPGGIQLVYRLNQKIDMQSEALARDQERNQRLSSQLKWLYHSKDAIEHHARQSLGMVKPGETFYLWVDQAQK